MPKESGRLRKVNDLVNQFVSSIKHKPLDTKMDQARVKAFITALRKLLTGAVVSVKPKPVPIVEQPIELTDEERSQQMKANQEAIRELKRRIE